MRIIETLILIDLLFSWLAFFASQNRRGLRLWISAAGLALVGLHLLLEGCRWQMLPAYLLVGLVFLWSYTGKAHAVRSVPAAARETKRPRRLLRFLGLGALLPLLVLAAALPALLPVYRLPRPTGPYPVGVTRFDWLDSSRPETLSPDPAARRELVVRAWYPAQPAPGSRPAPYWPDIDVGGPVMMNNWHFPTFIPVYLKLVETHACADAPAAQAPGGFPVLYFSHGFGPIDESKNTVQMEELASHGYVIFSINHPYESLATVYDDGRVVTLSEQSREILRHMPLLDQRIDDWAADTRFVMGQVERVQGGQIPSGLTGRLDLDRQGAFGFSYGGATAALVCLTDSRCDAGANLDGSLWGRRIEEEPLRTPFFFFDSSDSPGKNEDAYEMALAPVYHAVIQDTMHANFSDICGWTPLSPLSGLCGRLDARRMGTILNAYLLAFFDRYLQASDSALLNAPSPDFPEVKFESRNTR